MESVLVKFQPSQCTRCKFFDPPVSSNDPSSGMCKGYTPIAYFAMDNENCENRWSDSCPKFKQK